MNAPEIVVVGSANIDLVVSAERFAAPGETLAASSFQIFAGGKGANQAAAAARLGAATRLVARVGDDAFAPIVRSALADAGVELGGLLSTEGGTGTALITTVHGGQNSILVYPGANAHLRREDVDAAWPQFRGARVVLAQLEIPIDTVERLAVLCEDAGIPLVLDPAPAQDLSPALLHRIAWLTPNEAETLQLTGVDVSTASEPDLKRVAEDLLGRGPRGVVLKLGSRGAYVADHTRHCWIPPFNVQVVDTTAAGDAFNGAFAITLARLGDPFTAGTFACAAAALSTTTFGAIPSMPNQSAVSALLASASR